VLFAVFAPTGRRNVAAGGAARSLRDPTRNPWKADEQKESIVFFSFFRPGGAKEIFRADERTPVPGASSAPLGRMCRTQTLPRVARRRKRRRSTRGYNPSPRWGENGSVPFPPSSGVLFPAPGFFLASGSPFPVPGSRRLCRLAVAGSPFPVPAAPSPGMPGVCFPGARIPNPAFTLRCCEKATLSAPRRGCEKSNAVSVFGASRGMAIPTAPKR